MPEQPVTRGQLLLYLLFLTAVCVWVVGILLLGLVTGRMLENLDMIIRLAGL